MRSRRKQFEIRDEIAELAVERARLATLLDALPVGMTFVEPDGQTRLSNPDYRRILQSGEIPSRLADGEPRRPEEPRPGPARITDDLFDAGMRDLQNDSAPGVEGCKAD